MLTTRANKSITHTQSRARLNNQHRHNPQIREPHISKENNPSHIVHYLLIYSELECKFHRNHKSQTRFTFDKNYRKYQHKPPSVCVFVCVRVWLTPAVQRTIAHAAHRHTRERLLRCTPALTTKHTHTRARARSIVFAASSVVKFHVCVRVCVGETSVQTRAINYSHDSWFFFFVFTRKQTDFHSLILISFIQPHPHSNLITRPELHRAMPTLTV